MLQQLLQQAVFHMKMTSSFCLLSLQLTYLYGKNALLEIGAVVHYYNNKVNAYLTIFTVCIVQISQKGLNCSHYTSLVNIQ
jgi:hypothetical protein